MDSEEGMATGQVGKLDGSFRGLSEVFSKGSSFLIDSSLSELISYIL